MSALEAAGWALSRSQSVSVVPTIQCRPHGITNSTDFSVRRISPVVEWIRSLGTTRWMPLDARTWNCPRSPTIAWVSSVHTPGGVDDLPGADLVLAAALDVLHPGADHPLALAQETGHPRPVGDLRAVGRGRAHQGRHIAGVVHLRVVVLQRADQRVLLQGGRDPQGVAAGQVAVRGQARGRARGPSTSRRTARRPSPRTAAPSPCAGAGRGTAPASPGAGRAARAAARAPSAPRVRGRSRASPDSAGRRG